MRTNIKYLIIFLTFLVGNMMYCQKNQLKKIENDINRKGEYDKALFAINKLDTIDFSLNDKAYFFYLKAKCFDLKNSDDKAYINYIKAKELYQKTDSLNKIVDINFSLAYINYSLNKEKFDEYLNENLSIANGSNNLSIKEKVFSDIATFKLNIEEADESLKYFRKAQKINEKTHNKEFEIIINTNLGVLHNEYLNNPDSALIYLEKNNSLLKNYDNYSLCINYVNQAAVWYYKEKHKKAIELLNKANSTPIKKYVKSTKGPIYQFLSINYAELGNYKQAYENHLIYQKYQDSIKKEEQEIAINDIQTKYQTREKELENEVLTGKVKKKNILVYIVVGLLIASLIIGFLIVKNARRREHISKQEKLIEQQKLEKALKEYELSSIDLMLEGQEKERQRIANDLHDNLGSMLATLKMNFEHLRLRKNELREEENKLYDRTDELIEEAYLKVRRLAHAKNAGVFANEGLIPAIRKMAEKISIPGKLSIEVMAVGFNKRLENTIEIAIFRMVQELSTNIIKHSQATEASIQLTNHDENINIIIEDNGVGFSTAKTHTSDGMGLNTIRKKVEQLGGTFTIDSTPGKGTTIIIDLPI